jgi:hypothetical protein
VKNSELTSDEFITFMKIFKEKENFVKNTSPFDRSYQYQTPVPKETIKKIFFAVIKHKGEEDSKIKEKNLIITELTNFHGMTIGYDVMAYLGEGKIPAVNEILYSVKDDCYKMWQLRKESEKIRNEMKERANKLSGYNKNYELREDSKNFKSSEDNIHYGGLKDSEILELRNRFKKYGKELAKIMKDSKYLELSDKFKESEDKIANFSNEIYSKRDKNYVCGLFLGFYEMDPLAAVNKGISGFFHDYWLNYFNLKDEFGEEPHFVALHLSPPILWEFEVNDNKIIISGEGRITYKEAVENRYLDGGDVKIDNRYLLWNYFQWRWVEEKSEVINEDKYKIFLS